MIIAIKARLIENYQVEIIAADDAIKADEPVNAGGDNKGPNPYDLLLSALAACKIMTVQMYAQRKQWNLTGVELSMRTDKVHAQDCEDCESDPNAKVDIIETEITFLGDLDADQRKRLKDLSEKCPVHRTLTSETRIRTTLLTS